MHLCNNNNNNNTGYPVQIKSTGKMLESEENDLVYEVEQQSPRVQKMWGTGPGSSQGPAEV